MSKIIIHKFSDYLVQPWKNGGGKTLEITKQLGSAGCADFIWRLSIAEIKQDGHFSNFKGFDRTLMLLSGKGIELAIGDDQVIHRIDKKYSYLTFDGGASAGCKLMDGITTDFNIMTRQGVVSHDVRILKNINGQHCLTTYGETMLVFCLKGEVAIETDEKRFSLKEYDTFEINSEECERIFLNHKSDGLCAIILIKNI